MWQQLKAWWKTEGAMVQLQGLDDRLLADMGLAREGLRDRVRGNDGVPAPTPARVRAVACERC